MDIDESSGNDTEEDEPYLEILVMMRTLRQMQMQVQMMMMMMTAVMSQRRVQQVAQTWRVLW